MERQMIQIVQKLNDFKVCKECSRINFYENEQCINENCSSIGFFEDENHVQHKVNLEYKFYHDEGYSEDEIDEIEILV